MSQLADRSCVPVSRGTRPLPEERVQALLEELDGWDAQAGARIAKSFRFPDFAAALRFANRIGEVAEREDHHPDLHVSFGRVGVELRTHRADGLTENDFVLAAKIDRLAAEER